MPKIMNIMGYVGPEIYAINLQISPLKIEEKRDPPYHNYM